MNPSPQFTDWPTKEHKIKAKPMTFFPGYSDSGGREEGEFPGRAELTKRVGPQATRGHAFCHMETGCGKAEIRNLYAEQNGAQKQLDKDLQTRAERDEAVGQAPP